MDVAVARKERLMFRRQDIAYVLLFLVVGVSGGCASNQGEKTVQSFARTRETLGIAQGQVDLTLGALARVRATRGEGLKEAFGHYKDAVAGLEKEGENAKLRAAAMKEQSDTHIKAWQSEMAGIKDPAIKSTLEGRKEAVRSNFKLLMMYADDARKAYEPFLRGNQDIVRALSIDLSPAAMSSLATSMDGVVADGRALKQRLAAMQLALDNMANGVSPIGM